MKRFSYPSTFLTGVLLSTSSFAHSFDTGRIDAHAPISIMGEHIHAKGESMLSYRFMRMQMDGMRNGTTSASSDAVFAANYTITPEEMTMDMHMLGFMHAPSDQLTLMAMANYTSTEMDHRIFGMATPLLNFNGGSDVFTTETEGVSDIKLSALYSVYRDEDSRAHVGLGISLPTGSITESDAIPAPSIGSEPGMGGLFERQLPAPMQLGSGTYDLLPSFTWVEQRESVSFGGQLAGTIRTGHNDQGCRLGDQFKATAWGSLPLGNSFGISTGLAYQWSGKMRGEQEDLLLNPPFAPSRETVTTAFSDNYGGESIEAIFGVNSLIDGGILKGHRFAIDLRLPLWQILNGYQLETDWALTLGWQKAW